MRAAIIAAARATAVADGWPAVTIRKIADRIEYSPAAVYEYFESKDAILRELLRQGYSDLGDALAQFQHEEPARRIPLMVRAALGFANSSPEVYQVMHGLGGVPFGGPDAPIEARNVFGLVYQTFAELCPAAGRDALEDAVDSVWAALHGFVSLDMNRRMAGGHERTERLCNRAVDDLVRAFVGRAAAAPAG